VLSKLGWSYLLYITVLHISALTPAPAIQKTAAAVASTTVQRVLSYIPLTLRNATPLTQVKAKVYESIPSTVLPYLDRAKTLYSVVGPEVAVVQSFAIFDVLHSLLGLVRSPVGTTLAQVSSRLYLVWGIVERFPETRTNPIYASMVVAWSIAEIIRYTFYALGLFGFEPYVIKWLRYTAFYINYPLGAGSEAFLIFSTLPSLATLSSGSWTPEEYLRGGLFLIWWPGLYTMMNYMSRQRVKVLGGASGKRKTQ